MEKEYNIFTELNDNISDFYSDKIPITYRHNGKTETDITFSQPDTIEAIDLALNSKFKKGEYDSERQRKLYLNKVLFVRDVARMRTDIDVKNYVFNPDTYSDLWQTYFMSRRFKVWARDNYYGELLNRLGDDFATYGTVVLKETKGGIERVPVKNILCSQKGDSLEQIANTGGYVIEAHKGMTLAQMKEYSDWDTEGLEYGKEYDVYEKYALAPKNIIEGESGDEWVLTMQVLIPGAKDKKDNGKKLYVQEVKETPYQDAFWEKIDGRWLGRGPVEVQLENQLATNTVFNLRRRSLLWATKKLFQSASDEVQKNLVSDVRDGQVLNVGPNGQITPIPMETRSLNDFTTMDNTINENSKQLSFTYEVATGESMPSGTPFRLGAILSQAVDSYYGLKREQFGLFLKRSFFEQLVPVFKRDNRKEHNINIAANEEGVEFLKEMMKLWHTNRRYINDLLNEKLTPIEEIRLKVEEDMTKSPYFFITIPDKFYDDVKYHFELDITDEATDTKTDVETMTTLFQVLSQKGDPRADRILQMILGKTGRNLDVLAGKPQLQANVNANAQAQPTGDQAVQQPVQL